MELAGFGTLRVAEHFTVVDGVITRIRQVHDTAALRAAGFDQSSPGESRPGDRSINSSLPTQRASRIAPKGTKVDDPTVTYQAFSATAVARAAADLSDGFILATVEVAARRRGPSAPSPQRP